MPQTNLPSSAQAAPTLPGAIFRDEGLSPHRIATELSDIRREIARLKRREAALLLGEPAPVGRPGWPMQRLRRDQV